MEWCIFSFGTQSSFPVPLKGHGSDWFPEMSSVGSRTRHPRRGPASNSSSSLDGSLAPDRTRRWANPCGLVPVSGGDPAADSPTATLLRLKPPCGAQIRPPEGGLIRTPLGCFDGRCVQGAGTYSPRSSETRLLPNPASCGRVSVRNPNYDRVSEISAPSRGCVPLSRPL